MLHGLAAICHAAGSGGYIGSHCPKQCAPPLYSAHFVVKQFCTSVRVLAFDPFSLVTHSE